MKTIRIFARVLIAPVFIFSGFVKAIDPLGSTYKFIDYFHAMHLEFLSPLAFLFAVLLSTAELSIGLSLLLGNLMRVTSWVLLIFMTFFTFLTLYSAIVNPVTDCGCFGDALILTNWQTFWKNIAFMLPTLIIFFSRRKYKPMAGVGSEWAMLILFVAIGITISAHNYRNLPVLDFRPYKTGVNIPASMIIPPGVEEDEYETNFIYEKNGVKQEFSPENVPYQDTAWKYVSRVDKLVKEGYRPPIHDFTLSTLDRVDITDSVLSDTGYSVLVICHNLNQSDPEGLKRVNAFTKTMEERGTKVFGMTASTNEDIHKFENNYHFNFDFYTCDEIALKTVIRANPGIVLLKKGTIIGKWNFRDLPEIKPLNTDDLSIALSDYRKSNSHWVIGFYIAALCVLMLFLTLLSKK